MDEAFPNVVAVMRDNAATRHDETRAPIVQPRSRAIGPGIIAAGVVMAIAGSRTELIQLRDVSNAQAATRHEAYVGPEQVLAAHDGYKPQEPAEAFTSEPAAPRAVLSTASEPPADSPARAAQEATLLSAPDIALASAPTITPGHTMRAVLQALAPAAAPPPAATRPEARPASRSAASTPRPRLSLDLEIPADAMGRARFPLRIGMAETAPPASRLLIQGLPENATLSRGRLVGLGKWQAPVAGFEDITLTFPSLSPGKIELLVDLRSPADELLASNIFVVQVVPRPTAVQQAAAPSTAALVAAAPALASAPVMMREQGTLAQPMAPPLDSGTQADLAKAADRAPNAKRSRQAKPRSGTPLSYLGIGSPGTSSARRPTGENRVRFDPASVFDQKKGI